MTTYHFMHRKTTCHHGNDGYIYVLHFGSQLPRKDLVLCSHSNHGVVVAQNYSTCHEHYHGTSPALENSGHNVCFNLFAMVNEWRLLHSCAVADVWLGLVMSMMPPMGYRQALWGSRFWHPPTLLGRSCLWAAFKNPATFLLTNTVLQNDPVVGCRNSQPGHHERRMDPPQQ